MRIKLAEEQGLKRDVIKVLGVGGAGCNAINRMVEAGLEGAELIAANSDAQVLRSCQAHVCIQLGENLTKGKGVGGDQLDALQARLDHPVDGVAAGAAHAHHLDDGALLVELLGKLDPH